MQSIWRIVDNYLLNKLRLDEDDFALGGVVFFGENLKTLQQQRQHRNPLHASDCQQMPLLVVIS